MVELEGETDPLELGIMVLA
ncbi:hypothetical protein CCACVL1_04212 [Corchorus capsularis]|uniref:Uncharacterized protein n=1 Tax=Corchorus capsularis TaxID=210143 RepID=A0A1R3JUW7_COCAP|nr:hypothetical protein CCACVL1_04212 [Corchorus capsularis]